MSSPRVSVTMAVYNVAPFLREAVDSVLSQSFTDFEIVAVNDGSTDESAEILQTFPDPRIRLLHQENQGIAKTRNRLLREARGEYIAIFDPDDVMLPDRLAKQVAYLDAHAAVAVVGGQYMEMTEEGEELSRCLLCPLDPRVIRNECVARRMTICHGAAMIRRSILEELGGYNDAFGSMQEDEELFARILARFPGANLAEPVFKYRMRRGSAATANYMLSRRRRRYIQRQFERLTSSDDATAGIEDAVPEGDTTGQESADANYYSRIGRAALRGGRFGPAWRYYWKSISIRPWQWISYTGLIRAALRVGRGQALPVGEQDA